MQWSNGYPFVRPPFLDRLGLRHAALRYGAHSWPVLPRPGGRVVLLATGGLFDVIEVPAGIGLRAVAAEKRGPVAVAANGRWLFFVRPGLPLRSELDRCFDVVLHGPGSSVPAPPSRLPAGDVRWAVRPGKIHWRLPEPAGVQALLVDALGPLGHRPAGQEHVPRQLSTLRRAL